MNQTEYEKLTPEKKWENATIANNFISYKVMQLGLRKLIISK